MLHESSLSGCYQPVSSTLANEGKKEAAATTGSPAQVRSAPKATPASSRIRARLSACVAKAAFALRRPLPLPGSGLNYAQTVALLLIPLIVLSTLLFKQQLVENGNRAGFFAVALYVPVFLFATKAPLPLHLFSQSSYISWNFVHRWLGRTIFVLGLTHGSLWLHQYHVNGQLQQQLGELKVQRGIATLCFLFILNVSSLPWIRRRFYWAFFSLHVIGYVGALVLVSIHTPYARPWISYGAVLLYGLDLGIRFLALSSLTTATVTPMEGGITQVWVHHLNSGWKAGQHVHIRLGFVPSYRSEQELSFWQRCKRSSATYFLRPFESHPLTIAAAPPQTSTSPSQSGFPLYVRSQGPGTWTGDLHTVRPGQDVYAVVEGPYGNSAIPTVSRTCDTLLLVAGGSGITWALAVLDNAVGSSLQARSGSRLKKISFFWSIKFQSHARWFAAHIDALAARAREAGVDLEGQIFVSQAPPQGASSVPETGCQVSYASSSRPRLNIEEILEEAMLHATNPCSSCGGVCRCAESPENEGCCPRDEELCAGSPEANSSGGCCGSKKQTNTAGCCGEDAVETSDNCCSSKGRQANAWPEDEMTAVQLEPVLVRNHGLTLAVCGPKAMEVRSSRFSAL